MRIFRLVATPVLLLGLLALLVWGASWGWKNLTAPLPTPSPTPCVTTTTDLVTARDVSVRVLNGGFTSGLARRVKTQLEGAGFRVIKVDNSDERIKGTVIRANEKNVPGIRLASSYFVNPTVEYDDRVDGTVDVLVGSDFQGFTEAGFAQVSSGSDGTYCLAPTPTTSPDDTSSPEPSPSATNS